MDGIARHDGGGCAGGVDNRRNRDTHSREATMIQRGGRPVGLVWAWKNRKSA